MSTQPRQSDNARDARCRFCGRTREEHDPDERIDCPGGEGSRAIDEYVRSVWTDTPDDAPSYRDSYEWTVTDG